MKYISSSESKHQNFLMFSTHEMKYVWYSPKKKFFLFYTINGKSSSSSTVKI